MFGIFDNRNSGICFSLFGEKLMLHCYMVVFALFGFFVFYVGVNVLKCYFKSISEF